MDAFVEMCKYHFWVRFGQQFFLTHCEDVVIAGGITSKATSFEVCYPRDWRTFFKAVLNDIKGKGFANRYTVFQHLIVGKFAYLGVIAVWKNFDTNHLGVLCREPSVLHKKMTPESYGMQAEAMIHEISNHVALAFQEEVGASAADDEKASKGLFYVLYAQYIL